MCICIRTVYIGINLAGCLMGEWMVDYCPKIDSRNSCVKWCLNLWVWLAPSQLHHVRIIISSITWKTRNLHTDEHLRLQIRQEIWMRNTFIMISWTVHIGLNSRVQSHEFNLFTVLYYIARAPHIQSQHSLHTKGTTNQAASVSSVRCIAYHLYTSKSKSSNTWRDRPYLKVHFKSKIFPFDKKYKLKYIFLYR